MKNDDVSVAFKDNFFYICQSTFLIFSTVIIRMREPLGGVWVNLRIVDSRTRKTPCVQFLVYS